MTQTATPGRSPDPRTVANVGTTDTTTALTGDPGSFEAGDVGRAITGTGIPADTTIATVTDDQNADLSQAATATGTITATLGAGAFADYGFVGWAPETTDEADNYTVTAVNAGDPVPGAITDPTTQREWRHRA